MKTNILWLFLCIPTMSMCADTESWEMQFEKTKLPAALYEAMGTKLKVYIDPHAHDFNFISGYKMWLMGRKDCRTAFNNNTLDITRCSETFSSYAKYSSIPSHKEHACAPFFKNYSKCIALLFRMRFENIIGLREDISRPSKDHNNAFLKEFLKSHELILPFTSEEEYEIKFKEIPKAIVLAVYVDVISSLADATLKRIHNKTNPLTPLNFEHYDIPAIKQSSLSSESSQTDTSYTSSTPLSSDSYNPPSPQSYRKTSKNSTTPSDYSYDDITTISSSSSEWESSTSTVEEKSSEKDRTGSLIFDCDIE